MDTMQWGSFVMDATIEAPAMNRGVVTRSEIMDAFDDVAYKKGKSTNYDQLVADIILYVIELTEFFYRDYCNLNNNEK